MKLRVAVAACRDGFRADGHRPLAESWRTDTPFGYRCLMLVLDGMMDAGERIRLRLSSAVECCLALWVARAPEREPLAANARQLEARLPTRVARDAAKLD